MATEYYRVGSDIRTTIDYVDGNGVPQTGRDFTFFVSKNGVGDQSTAGITINEVDPINNAGTYDVTISGTTGFTSLVGTYELTVYDSSDQSRRWSETFYVTTTGDATDSTGVAYFASSDGDGRVVDAQNDPIAGASILVRNAANNSVITETTTDANGNWSVNINASANVFVIKSGYQQGQSSLTVSGDVPMLVAWRACALVRSLTPFCMSASTMR
jgi:hypothetical protein